MIAGPRLLASFLRQRRAAQQRLADALGVSGPAVSDWLTGKKRPRLEHRIAIDHWTSGAVPASAWLRRGERNPAEPIAPFTTPRAA